MAGALNYNPDSKVSRLRSQAYINYPNGMSNFKTAMIQEKSERRTKCGSYQHITSLIISSCDNCVINQTRVYIQNDSNGRSTEPLL